MIIRVDPQTHEAIGAHGEVIYRLVEAKVRIEFSPSEGYDCDKLAKLEKDLGEFVTERLQDALKKEEA